MYTTFAYGVKFCTIFYTVKKTSNVFCKKTQQLFNRKGKNCFGYGKLREKSEMFQPSVVICKINGKGNQTVFAGCAGKLLLICQKAHVAFSMKNKQIVCTIFDKVNVLAKCPRNFCESAEELLKKIYFK